MEQGKNSGRGVVPDNFSAFSNALSCEALGRQMKKIRAEEGISAQELARRMGVSRSVLTKKTKALIGISPVELIRDFRLRRAVALLEAGGRTITEVAFLTGFYDSHYFSKCFKQVYGVSPSDYCKKK